MVDCFPIFLSHKLEHQLEKFTTFILNTNNVYIELLKRSPILLQALPFRGKYMEETNVLVNRAIAGDRNCPAFTKNVATNNYFRSLEDHGQRTEQ